jgi:hypothetical protein
LLAEANPQPADAADNSADAADNSADAAGARLLAEAKSENSADDAEGADGADDKMRPDGEEEWVTAPHPTVTVEKNQPVQTEEEEDAELKKLEKQYYDGVSSTAAASEVG